MGSDRFKALVLRRTGDVVAAAVESISLADLPNGDTVVSVDYSGLNYKDGMAMMGRPGIVHTYPMVPGIDLAGTVESCSSGRFARGDKVTLNGWGAGERWWGGYAQKARVKADWLVPLPAGMTTRSVMAFGTAGLTAMLCIQALERNGIDRSREILVTGAAGGVGSVATLLLSKLGYNVVAATGRPEQEDYLRSLGAASILPRAALATPLLRPLLSERWGGIVDSVGGQILASALAGAACCTPVAACGHAGGRDLPATVLPFILRGISLLGINILRCTIAQHEAAWARIAELLPEGLPEDLIQEIDLAQLPAYAAAILGGHIRGRTVVNLKVS